MRWAIAEDYCTTLSRVLPWIGGWHWLRGTALDLEVEERKRLDGPLKGW